tara:strand:+ start:563 stop:874 length:312 start_codon:yes stop_codon:yes gene_type:complete
MAEGDLTKENIIDRMEVYGSWSISIRTSIRVSEEQADGSKKVVSNSFHRASLEPFESNKLADGSWEHTPTDLSNEEAKVKAMAEALWTDDVKEAYKKAIEENR